LRVGELRVEELMGDDRIEGVAAGASLAAVMFGLMVI
jgi:hypothetical protein